jgi:hypothetical protein
MDKGNTNKHRSTYSAGIKAVEREKWGRRTAEERYGPLEYRNGAPRPEDRSEPQRLGDSNNLRGPGWQDDHANDWIRGKNEDATKRPGFMPGYRKK